MKRLEQLTVNMYCKNCPTVTINEAQQRMFTQNIRFLGCIPPTKALLYQYVRRTVLLSAFVWYRALEKHLCVPNTEEYGWEWNEHLNVWFP